MENEQHSEQTPEKREELRQDIHADVSPEIKEKMKKNLVYIGIFSIVMVFAGLTSGYIVSMGDSFWVKFPLPTAFYVSTAIIILSSILVHLGVSAAKKGKAGLSKILVVGTFILGLIFVYFQIKGYQKLIDSGSHIVGNIMVVEGRYGSVGDDGRYYGYYEIKYNGKFIEIEGNDYLMEGKKLTSDQFSAVQNFVQPFVAMDSTQKIKLSNYGKNFELFYKQQALKLVDDQFMLPDSSFLTAVDLMRLKSMAINIRDGRGDFFIQGEIGKDFHVYYKGKELEYKDRKWQYQGKILDDYLQTKPLESPDTASSYLWLITLLHLAHILFALFYMGKMAILSLSGKFTSENTLSLRLGAIFWDFLGILWIYLLLFLLFIH